MAQAKAGDSTAGAALPELAKSLLEAGAKTSGSALDYAKIVASVKTQLGDVSAANMANGTKPADANDELAAALAHRSRKTATPSPPWAARSSSRQATF